MARSIATRLGAAQSEVPGLIVAAGLAAVASLLGDHLPVIGAPVIAIVLGVALRSLVSLPDAFDPGLRFAGRRVLQTAIVVSGAALSFVAVVRTGIATLPLVFVTIGVALLGAVLVGRLLGLAGVLRTLIGVGTAICGASAIAAVAGVIEPADDELVVSIATIFFYNVAAVLLFPPIGHLLGMSQHAFGVWAGTAINDTSSVVAAGYAYGQAAGGEATVVKLTRATMILPLVGAIALWRAHRQAERTREIAWAKIVPWFMVWFLLAAAANSAGLVPTDWHGGIVAGVTFLITVALAAIGLQTNVRALLRAGLRPLALGFCLWVLVALSSLAIQSLG